jgi:predicted Zn finger-like uncharacterized protein
VQTICPACHTTFRVHQEQLGLRRGLVRCGTCNAVFNAYDTLLPELEGAPLAEADMPDSPAAQATSEGATAALPARLAPDETEPRGAEEVVAEAAPGLSILNRQALSAYEETLSQPLEPEMPAQVDGAGEAGVADSGGADFDFAALVEPPTLEEAANAVRTTPAEASPVQETPESILLSELPNRQADKKPLPVWKLTLYLGLTLLLAVLLLGQLAYFLRAELAAALPASRPLLAQLCKPLGCAVPLPRQLTRQAIVSSSLEHDVEQKSRIRLTFLLANRTGQTQEWPHVVLTLIDLRESPVAQKALPPQDYLPKGISARAGFPAQSEQEVRLDLDIGNLSAASYLLDVAYPR